VIYFYLPVIAGVLVGVPMWLGAYLVGRTRPTPSVESCLVQKGEVRCVARDRKVSVAEPHVERACKQLPADTGTITWTAIQGEARAGMTDITPSHYQERTSL